eukprot:comp23850_c0_seq1/m.41679 comp23850_c0_seq1/g.41679  ORF comp23850_c0_seq1/g.41679 comp23850_c0_seq1/m.41679 type:complete len:368 (+) comp23850_c0_seq1:444-1547(+)
MPLQLINALDPLVDLAAQPLDHVLCMPGDGHLGGEQKRLPEVHDLAVCVLGGIRAEARVANQHLVHNDAHGPVVAGLVIARMHKHLGRNVVRRAHHRVGHCPAVLLPGHCLALCACGVFEVKVGVLLWLRWPLGPTDDLPVVVALVALLHARAQPKVRQLDVARGIDQHVVGFDIPVDEVELVDGVQGQGQLSNVMAGGILRECVVADQQGHHVSPGQKLHHQIQVLGILERVVELHHPRVVCLRQYVSLRPHVCQLVLEQHVCLSEYLHGIDVARVDLLPQPNLSKGAPAYDLECVEVLRAQSCSFEPQEVCLPSSLLQQPLTPPLLAQPRHLPLHPLAPVLALCVLFVELLVEALQRHPGRGGLV